MTDTFQFYWLVPGMFVHAGVYGPDQDRVAAATMHKCTSLGA